MRIAFGGIAAESCTFSPLSTSWEDLDIREGDALLDPVRFPFLERPDIDPVPLVQADALPGGPVAPGAYATIRQRFLSRLRAAGPIDALYLDLHGALVVHGLDDAERDWIRAARDVVGPGVLIGASLDLHANVSAGVAGALDVVTAFRTAPHVDAPETRARAVGLLAAALRSSMRPHVTHVTVPLLLPGEMQTTDHDPARSLYRSLAGMVRGSAVMDVSLLAGHSWADEPRAGASVVATGTDPSATRRAVVELAQRAWDARADFRSAVPLADLDECLAMALAADRGPVFISDAGDNPTAGAPGDVPMCLGRLLATGVRDAIVASIPDPAAVAACVAAGQGASVDLLVGGKLDPAHGRPLPVRATVERVSDDDLASGTTAVVRTAGVTVVLTSKRRAFTTVADLLRVGVDPSAARIVVMKLGYLFPDLARVAATSLLALTPGATDLVTSRLPYRHIRRPMFPLDDVSRWEPAPS